MRTLEKAPLNNMTINMSFIIMTPWAITPSITIQNEKIEQKNVATQPMRRGLFVWLLVSHTHIPLRSSSIMYTINLPFAASFLVPAVLIDHETYAPLSST